MSVLRWRELIDLRCYEDELTMRKLIVSNFVTVDGFYEDENKDIASFFAQQQVDQR